MAMVQVYHDGPLGRVALTEELDHDALTAFREFIRPFYIKHVSDPLSQSIALRTQTVFNISDVDDHDERLKIYDTLEELSAESLKRERTE